MPWSQWQDPFIVTMLPREIGVQFVRDAPDLNVTVPALTQPYRSDAKVLRGEWSGGTGIQFSMAGTGWDTYHEYWPPHLYDLQQGVDFDYIPGTFDYVEYDDAPNVAQGWQWTAPFRAGSVDTNQGREPAPDPPLPLTGWAGLTLGTDYPLITNQPTGTYPGVGEVFATWTESGALLPSAPAPGADVTSFTILVEASMPDATWGGVDTFGFTEMTYAQPKFPVLLPRWRYWIPGPDKPLPLRQRQRDDGLGIAGVPRWRGGTSRQASNRWRGYL